MRCMLVVCYRSVLGHPMGTILKVSRNTQEEKRPYLHPDLSLKTRRVLIYLKQRRVTSTFRPALNSPRLLAMNKPTEKEAWKLHKHLG